MLHFGEQNFVAALEVRRAPGVCHEVNAFCGAARENDFVAAGSVNELRSAVPGCLESGGGAVAQLMNATMHIRVVMLVIIAERVDDRDRLLGGGSVIEINKRM